MVKINNLPDDDDPYVNKAYDTADQIERIFCRNLSLSPIPITSNKTPEFERGLSSSRLEKIVAIKHFLKKSW